ncbi:MAG: GNAT family N-acetyltransferase [Clostridia bacterium]|nr:GNAT family N-acetyltransferase [Clostridia bacterium]
MKKDILIKKVDTIEECKICNNLFAELIEFERNFDDTIVTCPKIEDYYERTLGREDSVLFLAISKGVAVGYVMAYIQNQKRSTENFVTIMNLYINPEYRKNGIGRSLIEHVEIFAKEKFSTCVIEIDCFINNKAAIEFYTKLDFKDIRVKMRKKI